MINHVWLAFDVIEIMLLYTIAFAYKDKVQKHKHRMIKYFKIMSPVESTFIYK